MGPERKDKLASPNKAERESQELEALLATSRRLVAEMEVLLHRAKAIGAQHVKVLQSIEASKKRK